MTEHDAEIEIYRNIEIHSTNKRYMREYEQHLNEKARMDMRVGRKPKKIKRE